MAINIATPSLETGDNLSREEFLAIWEQLPDIKFAELIGGLSICRRRYSNNTAEGIGGFRPGWESTKRTRRDAKEAPMSVRLLAKIACNPMIIWLFSRNTAASHGVKSTWKDARVDRGNLFFQHLHRPAPKV